MTIGRRRVLAGDVVGSAARAEAAWRELWRTSVLRRGGGNVLVMDGPGADATIAPLGAVVMALSAALALSDRTAVDDLTATLELYRWRDDYADLPGTDATSAASSAAIVRLTLDAHGRLDPPVDDSIWLHRAKRVTRAAFGDGPVPEPAPIEAADLVRDEGWWLRPPATNVVALDQVVAAGLDASVLAAFDRYLERLWREARAGAAGPFVEQGIARSPGVGPTLDHAAVVRLYARHAELTRA